LLSEQTPKNLLTQTEISSKNKSTLNFVIRKKLILKKVKICLANLNRKLIRV